jgi:hypothetical protein
MIVVDYNQTAISNLMAEIGHRKDLSINIGLVRHMIANSLRGYNVKFGKEYGEMIIACDSFNYWRKKVFPFYKANRKKAREESGYDWNSIFEALSIVREEIREFFPYKILYVESAEADDIIAIIAKWSQTNDLREIPPFDIKEPKPFLIISSDHDFIQLQRYKNAKQYSPLQKKYVTATTTPEKYVLEHTIRGDKGDGIPNVFSEDDSLVTGQRQKAISQKRLEGWLDDPTTLPHDDEFLARYKRNKMLVDFTQIPAEIENAVINNFTQQPTKNKSKMLNYFINNKMKNMLDVIEEF